MKNIKYFIALACSLFFADFYAMEPVAATVESYFVPKDQQAIRNRLFQLLDNAKNQVLVAIYWITDDEITRKLLEIRDKNKRLNIQIIIDESMSQLDNLLDTFLSHNMAPIIHPSKPPYGSGIMHNKFLVIDNTYVLTGSANFTKSAFDQNIRNYNYENIIVINSPNIAQKFKADFFSIKKDIFKFYIGQIISSDTSQLPQWWRRLLPHLYIKNPDFAQMVDEEIKKLAPKDQSEIQRLFDIKIAPQRDKPRGRPISDYQREILEREGIPTEGMTYDEAYEEIGEIMKQKRSQPSPSVDRPWETPTQVPMQDPATSGQEYFLKRAGQYRPGMSKQEASDLIGIIKSQEHIQAPVQEPATQNQQSFLKRAGQYRPGMSKQEASALIGRIKKQEQMNIQYR